MCTIKMNSTYSFYFMKELLENLLFHMWLAFVAHILFLLGWYRGPLEELLGCPQACT